MQPRYPLSISSSSMYRSRRTWLPRCTSMRPDQPTCPICEGRRAGVVTIGPDEHFDQPCGHRLPSDHDALPDDTDDLSHHWNAVLESCLSGSNPCNRIRRQVATSGLSIDKFGPTQLRIRAAFEPTFVDVPLEGSFLRHLEEALEALARTLDDALVGVPEPVTTSTGNGLQKASFNGVLQASGGILQYARVRWSAACIGTSQHPQ